MASLAAVNAFPELSPESVLIGRSAAMMPIRQVIERVASCNLPVLIVGEAGTGKEMLARTVHLHSAWALGTFFKTNWASLMNAPLEREIFGTDLAGAGRTPLKPVGEIPRRGTLFLNDIAELSLPLQGQLLRLLEDSVVVRTTGEHRTELRLICATKQDLREAIAAGRFREDLYYRINVLQMMLPPLRDRREDIPELVDHLIASVGERNRYVISGNLTRLLQEYHWPGNIRELENLMKRYVVFGSEEAVSSELLKVVPGRFTPEITLDGATSLKKMTRQAVREIERRVILQSLQDNNWNRKRVARALHISYRALLYKIHDAGLSSSHPPAKGTT